VATQEHRDNVERQIKMIWRGMAVGFAVIAVVMLALYLSGVVSIGFAVGIWIGLLLLWVIGYTYGVWASRRL
jgi:hypothetical protein